jgi:hypothetical protein
MIEEVNSTIYCKKFCKCHNLYSQYNNNKKNYKKKKNKMTLRQFSLVVVLQEGQKDSRNTVLLSWVRYSQGLR